MALTGRLLHWQRSYGDLRPPHTPAPGAGCVRIDARGPWAARHPLLAGTWCTVRIGWERDELAADGIAPPPSIKPQ
eukprot:14109-Prymnesium_polylepis.1